MKKYLILLFILSACIADIPEDIVTTLPQWPADRNFIMYSGLIDMNDSYNSTIHYQLLTKAGTKTTNNDAPLFLWLTGGPGCSSLDSFLTEIGPFEIEDGSYNVDGYNAWTWLQIANLLFIESPPGVGFSTSTMPYTPELYNENATTQFNMKALEYFFEHYPELSKNDFWITGESYGGVYIPYLAVAIDEYNDNSPTTPINLKGISIGNGVIGRSERPDISIDLYYGHHLISEELYNAYYQECQGDLSEPKCQAVFYELWDQNYGINPYNIYAYCYPPYAEPRFSAASEDGQSKPRHHWLSAWELLFSNGFSTELDVLPCLWAEGLSQYLDQTETKTNLHVSQDVSWTVCNGQILSNYNRSSTGAFEKYQKLIELNKYKILIYSGDIDTIVPYPYTEYWLEQLGVTVVNEWRPWYQGDQVAGFVQVYNALTFATVKGAGHIVPADKRPESLSMLTAFIQGNPLPLKLSEEEVIERIEL